MENVIILPQICHIIATGEHVIVNAKTFVEGHKTPKRVLIILLYEASLFRIDQQINFKR